MYCPRCNGKCVQGVVYHEWYWYCRGCKLEVRSPLSSPRVDESIVDPNTLKDFYTTFSADGGTKMHCSYCTACEGEQHKKGCNRPNNTSKRTGTYSSVMVSAPYKVPDNSYKPPVVCYHAAFSVNKDTHGNAVCTGCGDIV